MSAAASPENSRRSAAAMLVAVTVTLSACAGVGRQDGSSAAGTSGAAGTTASSEALPSPRPAGGDGQIVVAAGDIACPDSHPSYNGGEGTAKECRQKHTSDLLVGADRVFVLGNAQYPTGSLRQYRVAFDPTWGRHKAAIESTPGDHDYKSGNAHDYLEYFGAQEYYSFDIGSWHWISLNSEIAHDADSPQLQWLQQDLAGTSKPCIGALLANPAFSSGREGGEADVRPLWDVLYAAGADLVLSAENHHYERFSKQAPDGTATEAGIRQFVVGTGGYRLTDFGAPQPNSESRGKVFGVLQLRLGADEYAWQFLPVAGETFSDSGTTSCNS